MPLLCAVDAYPLSDDASRVALNDADADDGGGGDSMQTMAFDGFFLKKKGCVC